MCDEQENAGERLAQGAFHIRMSYKWRGLKDKSQQSGTTPIRGWVDQSSRTTIEKKALSR
jgi:hypothetical protein